MDLPDTLKGSQLIGMNLVHRTLLAVSGGRVGRRLGSMPVVELHTIGRTSGRHRTIMLTTPLHGDGRWILVASNGGDDRHPDCHHNLVAHPDAELTVDGTTVAVSTRTATEAERTELWPQVVATYRGHANHQTKTDRDIPLVICTPRQTARTRQSSAAPRSGLVAPPGHGDDAGQLVEGLASQPGAGSPSVRLGSRRPRLRRMLTIDLIAPHPVRSRSVPDPGALGLCCRTSLTTAVGARETGGVPRTADARVRMNCATGLASRGECYRAPARGSGGSRSGSGLGVSVVGATIVALACGWGAGGAGLRLDHAGGGRAG